MPSRRAVIQLDVVSGRPAEYVGNPPLLSDEPLGCRKYGFVDLERIVSRLCRVSRIALLVALVLGGSPYVARADNNTYVYDANGRVISVIYKSGATAIYNYDADGNLVSIVTPSAGTIAIAAFLPQAATISSPVTIFGQGFSATPASNTVKLNGVVATVSASTVNQLTVTVPAGATTGTITVTVAGNTAASATSFTVLNSPAPTIASFSPVIGNTGTSITINGKQFASPMAEHVYFSGVRDGAAAATTSTSTSTQIATSVPGAAVTGPISVSTQYGTGTSTQSFVVLPSNLPSGVSASTVSEVAQTTIGGAATSYPLSKANTQAAITFSVSPGVTAISLAITASTLAGGANIFVYGPANQLVTSSAYTSAPANVYSPTLNPGTYLLLIVPTAGSTGAVTLRILNASPVTGSLTIGGPASQLANAVPGQQIVWTFQGTSGQQINVDVNGYSGLSGNSTILLLDSQGYTYGSIWIGSPDLPGGMSGPFTLNMTGTYTLVLVPSGAATGSATVQVLKVLPPVTGTLTVGGPSVQLTNTASGQQLVWTFAGSAGQQIVLQWNGSSGLSGNSTIVVNDQQGHSYPGTWIGLFGLQGNVLGPMTLRATGTYAVVLSPSGLGIGSAAMQLLSGLSPVTGVLTIEGPPVQLQSSSPAQQLIWTFQGAAGQQVSVELNRFVGLSGNSSLTLFDQKGHSYGSLSLGVFGLVGSVLGPYTLNETGTYTIVISPSGLSVGSATVQVLGVLPPVIGTLAVGGSAVQLSAKSPGQQLVWMFPCRAGQGVTLAVNAYSGLSGNSTISLYDQMYHFYGSGSLWLLSNGSKSTSLLGPYTINVGGTCTATLAPVGLGGGSATLQVASSASGAGASFVTGSLTTGGAAVQLANAVAGQPLVWTFQGSGGQHIIVALDRFSGLDGGSTLGLYDQEGNLFGRDNLQFISNGSLATVPLGPYTLPLTETYSIVLVPSGSAVGSAAVRAVSVAQAATGTLTVGGPSVQLVSVVAGQQLTWTFQGTTGQQISVALDRYAGLNGASTLAIYDEDGNLYGRNNLQFMSNGSSATVPLGPYSLPRIATYRITITPSGFAVGSAAVRVIDVAQAATGILTVGGAAVQLGSTVAGQELVWTFPGTAGQQISIALDRYSGLDGFSVLGLYDAYGNEYGHDWIQFISNGSSATAALGPYTLPRTGTYQIVLMPSGFTVGSAALRVMNTTPVTGTLTIGGPALTLTNVSAWQSLVWTFAGTQGQKVSVWLPNVSGLSSGSQVSLSDEEGRMYLQRTQLTSLPNNNAGTYTLSTTGTYTIKLVPADAATGSATVQVSH
jgi:YD repeat-containing protein